MPTAVFRDNVNAHVIIFSFLALGHRIMISELTAISALSVITLVATNIKPNFLKLFQHNRLR